MNPTDPWLHHNTDWFDEALKSVSLQRKMDLSISGGTENVQYYLSFGGLTEDGFYENSATRYNQYNFRSNLDGKLKDNISIGFDVTGRYEDRNYPTVGAGTTFEKLIRGKPDLPAFWPNGAPGPAIDSGENPVVTGTDVTGFDHDDRYYLQTNLRVNLEVPSIDGLAFRGTAAFDKDFLQRKLFKKPWILSTFDRDAYINQGTNPEQFLAGSLNGPEEPELNQWNEDGFDLTTNMIGEYRLDLIDHSFNFLLGTEYQTFRKANFQAFRRGFISDQIPELFAGGTDNQFIDGNSVEGTRLNFFTRVNYNYKTKYLLELIGRYDGSYIFPEDRRYGFFPAVSFAWRVTQEDWFRDITGFFDELKIRTSYGQTGNDRIEPYQFLANFGFGPGYNFGIDNEVSSITQTQTPNPFVTWEVATQFDIGIESEMFGNRLRIELDYFDNLREDILHFRNASVPLSTGLVLPRENIGEVKSWGIDGTISWRQQVNQKFFYRIRLTGGYATNEIKFWDETPGVPDYQRSTGAKMRTPLMFIADGVFETQNDVDNSPSWPGARPGDIRFRDVNGDGEITAADRVRVDRNDIPEWMGGLILNASYSNFDFTAFFQGAAGAAQYIRTASGEFGNYYKEFAENRWTPENPNANNPRTFSRLEEYWMANDNTFFYRKTDYLRLKNLEIGYTLPGMDLRVYANGFNLLTWDTFKLGDPEASSQQRGGSYPQQRIFNLGLSFTF